MRREDRDVRPAFDRPDLERNVKNANSTETMIKFFEEPDEVITFEKGQFEIVRIGGAILGRATSDEGTLTGVAVNSWPPSGTSGTPQPSIRRRRIRSNYRAT
jgi:hypothetical protein